MHKVKIQKSAIAFDGALSNGKDLMSPVPKSSGADDMVTSLKRIPIARMAVFNNIEEARQFALHTSDCMQSEEDQPSRLISDFLEPPYRHVILLRKHVIAGEYEMVKSMIKDNPRTLITSCGQPANLIMSFDYNVIHICAQYNRPKIAEFILSTISSRFFINLFLKDRMKPIEYVECGKNLLNVFLNMTDKIWGETPLHIAAKYGHLEVVKVLTSFSLCKSDTNKDGHLPVDIICKYATDSTDDICSNIKQLLLERYRGPQDLSISLNNEDTERAQHFQSYRKRLSGLSFESPLSPNDYRLPQHGEKSVNGCRSVFSPTSEGENCIESSDKVLAEPNAEVKQSDDGVNSEMFNVVVSSTPFKQLEDSSSFYTCTLISKHNISSTSTLDLSSSIMLNETVDISDMSPASKESLYSNPWQKIEQALIKNIKLIATLLIQKLHNMSSSNGFLIFHLKRLHVLICTFQKEEQFSEVAFEKIHSRVASLLVTSMAKLQNLVDIMANVESTISEVLSECPYRIEEFIKCVSSLFLKKLEESGKIHPNSIQTDKLCAIVMWMEEESCNCQWQDNSIDLEISTEPIPKLRNVRKRLNEDITENLKKLKILDDESTKIDIQVHDEMKALKDGDHQEVVKEMKNTFIHEKDKGEIFSDEKSSNCSIVVSKCNDEKSKNSDHMFCMASIISSLDNILDDKSAKNDLDVDKEIKSLQNDDNRQVLRETKNNFLSVKDKGAIRLKTFIGNVKKSELINTKSTLPLSIQVSKKGKRTAQNIPKSGNLLVLKTPEQKSKGLFSEFRQKLDSDEEDNLLTKTPNIYQVSSKTIESTNKTIFLTSQTIKKPLILTKTDLKQKELFTKYRQQLESDDDTLLGSNESNSDSY